MKLSMDDIKDTTIGEGVHQVVLEEAKFKFARTGARMIELKFKNQDDNYIYDSVVTAKADGTVNHPGWSKLKQLFKAAKANITEFCDDDVEHLMLLSGLSCNAQVKMEEYEGVSRPKIKKYTDPSEVKKEDNFAI